MLKSLEVPPKDSTKEGSGDARSHTSGLALTALHLMCVCILIQCCLQM